MNDWELAYAAFDPPQEGLREALCALGNGRFVTRGAAPEAEANDTHYPGTYMHAVYDRLSTDIAGRSIENEDLVNLPNWLPLTFRIDGGTWFHLESVDILDYGQRLDMRQGVLQRSIRFKDHEGRTTQLEERRIVSMADPYLAALTWRIRAEDWSGDVEIRAGLDGRIINAGVARYRELQSKHLVHVHTEAVRDDSILLQTRTVQSGIDIGTAARTRIHLEGIEQRPPRTVDEEPGYIAQHATLRVEAGQAVDVEKTVAIVTSNDHAIASPGEDARDRVLRAGTFGELLAAHSDQWRLMWQRFGVETTSRGSDDFQRNVNLHLFHLMQTSSKHSMDLDASVPARGLHGEAYRGHIFWDELYVLPLMTFRMPELTRAALMYRYRRLDAARHAAVEAGHRGAMYPWQSGSTGREESQQMHLNPRSGRWLPDNSSIQRHVNAAIAYNIWHYVQVTDDLEFLRYYGAEMFLEIARFWASMASWDEDKHRYRILGVMGPDEYHDAYPDAETPGLDDNAYTNAMASWILWRAQTMLDGLPDDRREEIRQELHLGDEELARWDDISRGMRLVLRDGILSQFDGFHDLKRFDTAAYEAKYGDIHRLDRILEAEGDTPNRYQIAKQPDALMLLFLFSEPQLDRIFRRMGYRFRPDDGLRMIDHYIERTVHGSTLSRSVQAWLLARYDGSRSWNELGEAIRADVEDVQGGTTKEGIHLGAMASTVDVVQRGYVGMFVHDDVLWFDPRLPAELEAINMRIRFRGHSLDVQVTREELRIDPVPSPAAPVQVGMGAAVRNVVGSKPITFQLDGEGRAIPDTAAMYR